MAKRRRRARFVSLRSYISSTLTNSLSSSLLLQFLRKQQKLRETMLDEQVYTRSAVEEQAALESDVQTEKVATGAKASRQ